MKIMTLLVVAIVWCAVCPAFGQYVDNQQQQNSTPSMYDPAYNGPMNIYGQPVLIRPEGNNNNQQNQPSPYGGGPIHSAINGIQQVGSYFWGFLPAPVRGQEPPPITPSGPGQVTVNFVPGVR